MKSCDKWMRLSLGADMWRKGGQFALQRHHSGDIERRGRQVNASACACRLLVERRHATGSHRR